MSRSCSGGVFGESILGKIIAYIDSCGQGRHGVFKDLKYIQNGWWVDGYVLSGKIRDDRGKQDSGPYKSY